MTFLSLFLFYISSHLYILLIIFHFKTLSPFIKGTLNMFLYSFNMNNLMLKLTIFLDIFPLLIKLPIFIWYKTISKQHLHLKNFLFKWFYNKSYWWIRSNKSTIWLNIYCSYCIYFYLWNKLYKIKYYFKDYVHVILILKFKTFYRLGLIKSNWGWWYF